jgi:hypothetical protein
MRLLYFILITTLLNSCTEIYFTEAQPKEISDLESFPASWRASYSLDQDTFIIQEKGYSFPVVYEKTLSKEEIERDSNLSIEGDLFYDREMGLNTGLKFELKHDSVHYRKSIRSFNALSDSFKIKLFEKKLIMNRLDRKRGYWSVFVLETKGKDILVNTIGHLQTEEKTRPGEKFDAKLSDFTTIVEFKKLDNDKYLIDPDKDQFGQLIKKGLFSSQLKLVRIK